jgi:hypothetical protein
MSCWVAPAVAAEIWGVSVQQVMERVGAGLFPSKVELGFTVVNIAPGCYPKSPRPQTFTVVEREVTDLEVADAEVIADEAEPLGFARRRRSVGSTRRAPAAS